MSTWMGASHVDTSVTLKGSYDAVRVLGVPLVNISASTKDRRCEGLRGSRDLRKLH